MSHPDPLDDRRPSWLGRLPAGLWIALALVLGSVPWAALGLQLVWSAPAP